LTSFRNFVVGTLLGVATLRRKPHRWGFFLSFLGHEDLYSKIPVYHFNLAGFSEPVKNCKKIYMISTACDFPIDG
jgi:hypothetical protein